MLNGLYHALIPPTLSKNVITYSHAKNVINVGLISLVACPSFACIYYVLNFPLASLVIILLCITITSSVLLFRYLPLFVIRTVMVASLYACLTWLTYYQGGITSPPTYWFILLPLLAVILGSAFAGVIWDIIAIATLTILYYLESHQYPIPITPVSNPLFLHEASAIGLILIILYLAYFVEKGKRDAAREIQDINMRLKISNEKVNLLFKKAIDANLLKNEFLSNMSHELKNPINAIIGFTELMQNNKIEPDKYNEYFNDILVSATHLLRMVTDMLDVANFEFGTYQVNVQPVNCLSLISRVKDFFNDTLVEKGLNFMIDIDNSLINLTSDPMRLKQIFTHLISNAVKFTEKGGSITVRVYPISVDRLQIEVHDTGIGIREEDISKLFVPFHQLDSSIAKKYPGTGIGLALIKRVAQAQGGEVGVKSTFGKGSTFYVILPLHPYP